MYYSDFLNPWHYFGPIISWIIFIWVICMIFRWSGLGGGRHRGNWMHHHDHSNNENDTAMSVLKERFAKGEISKEEFEEKKKVLEA